MGRTVVSLESSKTSPLMDYGCTFFTMAMRFMFATDRGNAATGSIPGFNLISPLWAGHFQNLQCVPIPILKKLNESFDCDNRRFDRLHAKSFVNRGE